MRRPRVRPHSSGRGSRGQPCRCSHDRATDAGAASASQRRIPGADVCRNRNGLQWMPVVRPSACSIRLTPTMVSGTPFPRWSRRPERKSGSSNSAQRIGQMLAKEAREHALADCQRYIPIPDRLFRLLLVVRSPANFDDWRHAVELDIALPARRIRLVASRCRAASEIRRSRCVDAFSEAWWPQPASGGAPSRTPGHARSRS